MKVAEVRNALKKYDQDTLIELFVSAYKMAPKARKEDELDPLIMDYKKVIEDRKSTGKTKKNAIVDFAALENEIELFISNAYDQNYVAPNRVVPKAKRSKWRFMVKGYIKQLTTVTVDDSNYESSVKLLLSLYKMLCYGCGYYIFSTDDPFNSIGMQQPNLYRIVAERTFATGYSPQKIRAMINLAVEECLSREALHTYMYFELANLLKTPDLKNIAILEAKEMIVEENTRHQETLSKMTKKERRHYNMRHADYEHERIINELSELVMILYLVLQEFMEGVPFFYKTYQEKDKEIILFILLRTASMIEDNKIWKQVYEDGIKRGIEPRESLQEMYKELKV